ncbi:MULTISPECIES: hypothetical protein [Actinomycetes]|uniref:hypothetical protein n=1 Tax=Micromonospora sp. NPDC005367 TaxID=3155590 RepID=UPI0033B57351
MTELRLLGCGSKDGGCPALYATDNDTLIVQGLTTRAGNAVLIPHHQLLDWAEPGSTITMETTDNPELVLVAGTPVTDDVRSRLILDPDETAVEVPRCGL